MNRSVKCLMILMLYGCIPFLAVFSFSTAWKNLIAALISCVVCTISCKILKKRDAPDIRKNQVAVLMTAFAAIAILSYLLSGLHFGFSRVVLLGSLILTHVIPFVIIIITSEVTRRVLLAQRKRVVLLISLVAFTAVDIFVMFVAEGGVTAFRMLCTVVFPALASNFLYHYIAGKYGIVPNILYRVLILCYPYFVPIRPQVPPAILAVARVMLPVLVLSFIGRLYAKRKRRASRRRSWFVKTGNLISLLLCALFIMLVAGVGKYKMLVIGSESMSGVMDKGDAVIYEEYTDQSILVGDIILFERDGVIIVHRVIDIEAVNGVVRYYTKGDANDSADIGYITDERIVGISALTLKYIGYPAVWARSL